MSVADLTLAAYAVLTVVSLFGAGRLWGQVSRADGWRRGLGTLFAAAETVLLTYYLVWTGDRFHRSSYIIMDAAVFAVVLSGVALVLFSVRKGRKGPMVSATVLLALIGTSAAGYTMVARDVFWPPFAVFSLALFTAPAVALVARRVRGYQVLRDPEALPWAVLFLVGLGAAGETVSMVGLVPGTAWFGRPSLLHFFLAGTVVVTWLSPPPASPSAPTTDNRIPWHLFNPPLSPREADLVAGLRRRLTNKELATETGVTESTIKKHLVNVFRKASVTSRQELFERLDGPR